MNKSKLQEMISQTAVEKELQLTIVDINIDRDLTDNATHSTTERLIKVK